VVWVGLVSCNLARVSTLNRAISKLNQTTHIGHQPCSRCIYQAIPLARPWWHEKTALLLSPGTWCPVQGFSNFDGKTDTTLFSHRKKKGILQPCFAKTWQTASSMVSGLQSQLTLISGRQWCWLAEATQLVRTAGYLSWMRLPFPLAGSPGNEHDANCRVQQTMIMCAARSQQARAWAPNLRLALHSTKAPT